MIALVLSTTNVVGIVFCSSLTTGMLVYGIMYARNARQTDQLEHLIRVQKGNSTTIQTTIKTVPTEECRNCGDHSPSPFYEDRLPQISKAEEDRIINSLLQIHKRTA